MNKTGAHLGNAEVLIKTNRTVKVIIIRNYRMAGVPLSVGEFCLGVQGRMSISASIFLI
jgi:hypothetical protein